MIFLLPFLFVVERTQMSKQRINSSGKRGDKRNGKVPKGNFSLKNGLISFSSAAGGHNFLGTSAFDNILSL